MGFVRPPAALRTPIASIRRLAWFAAAACLLLAVAGCSNSKTLVSSAGTQVIVGTDDGNNMAGVGFGGVIDYAGTCLGLRMGGNEEVHTVIWPPGTEITDEDPFTIHVPGLGDVGIGQSIEGGGLSYEDRDLPNGVHVPKKCNSEVISFFPNHA
jgi:hypothetical protein